MNKYIVKFFKGRAATKVEKVTDDVSSVYIVDADNEEQAKRKARNKRTPIKKIDEQEYLKYDGANMVMKSNPLKDYDGNIIQNGVLKHVGRNETILVKYRIDDLVPFYIDHNGKKHKLTQEIAKCYRQHLVLWVIKHHIRGAFFTCSEYIL